TETFLCQSVRSKNRVSEVIAHVQVFVTILRMQLQDTADTTTLNYWLNWRVYLCAVSVLLPMVVAFLVIWKYEGSRDSMPGKGENQQDGNGTLPCDEAWKPCLKEIHPICLLVFRVIAFASLLATLIAKM
ncbi:hypothetical protein PIB30_067952, partial [Stylosanthes scabra]|nr:hypothetical protein [Stylosanthes scabra]